MLQKDVTVEKLQDEEDKIGVLLALFNIQCVACLQIIKC